MNVLADDNKNSRNLIPTSPQILPHRTKHCLPRGIAPYIVRSFPHAAPSMIRPARPQNNMHVGVFQQPNVYVPRLPLFMFCALRIRSFEAALKLQISTLVLLRREYQEQQQRQLEVARVARLEKGRTSKERAPEASRLMNTGGN